VRSRSQARRWRAPPSRHCGDGSKKGRAIGERATANLSAVPVGGRPLSDGLVVEASVVARLLSIRLLAIDARVVISPAYVERRLRTSTPPMQSRAIGARLAVAERVIDEGAASLAASRASGMPARRPRAPG
jgi:hypothetical protein